MEEGQINDTAKNAVTHYTTLNWLTSTHRVANVFLVGLGDKLNLNNPGEIHCREKLPHRVGEGEQGVKEKLDRCKFKGSQTPSLLFAFLLRSSSDCKS